MEASEREGELVRRASSPAPFHGPPVWSRDAARSKGARQLRNPPQGMDRR
jgi:hypothetical protein